MEQIMVQDPEWNEEAIQRAREEKFARKEAKIREESEQMKKAFLEKVMAARQQPPANVAPQPVTQPMLERTRLEMEAGAAVVKRNAEKAARMLPKAPDPGEGTCVPVFRPSDYVHEKGSADKKLGVTQTNVRA